MKKYTWMVALLMALGLALVGCSTGDDGDDITYTVAADGVKDTTASTKITFTFAEEVTGLEAGDITIANGSGKATKGALTGSGTAWTLAIANVSQGDVKVKIAKSGIEKEEKTVAVHNLPGAGGGGGGDDDDLYELGAFTFSTNENQKGWGFAMGDGDGDLDWDFFQEATYLVLELEGHSNANGVAGLQVVLQGDGNSWSYPSTGITVIKDWVDFTHTATDTVYIAIKLDTLADYAKVAGGNKAKLTIAAYPLTELSLSNAYLTTKTLTKPATNSADIAADGTTFGFITTEAILD